jgi:hypothetical protein
MRRTHGLGLALTGIFAACGGGGGGPDPTGDDDDAPAIDGGVGAVDARTTPQPGDVPDGGTPDGGASTSPDAAPPSDGCAVAPTGDWAGFARIRHGGGSANEQTGADVTWTLASTEACVDQYAPSGTVEHFEIDAPTETAPLAASDGELVIDRSAAPATYRVRGDSSLGTWADATGAFDGTVISGGYDDDYDAVEWTFTGVGTVFPAPDGCVEPATDQWTGTASVAGGTSATITWTRIETLGCLDHYQPSGTATMPTSTSQCTTLTADPPSAPIEPSHGELSINRSTNPPTFELRGATEWTGTITCTRADGTTTTEQGTIGGPWGWYVHGSYDGDTWRGATGATAPHYTWGLTRAP